MITFPVKTDKENSAISPSFGKAKYFAFYDGQELNVERNPFGNGAQLIAWFKEKGVEKIIIKEMGSNPYKKIKQTNMKVYFAGEGRVTSNDLIEQINKNSLRKLNEEDLLEIIKHHEGNHSHDHNHDHHH